MTKFKVEKNPKGYSFHQKKTLTKGIISMRERKKVVLKKRGHHNISIFFLFQVHDRGVNNGRAMSVPHMHYVWVHDLRNPLA